MRMQKTAALVLALTIGVSMSVTGCAAKRPQSPTQVGYRNNNIYNPGYNVQYNGRLKRDLGNFPGTNYGYGDNRYNNTVLSTQNTQSEVLARACKTVPGVRGASVVVSGNTAYVGLDIDTANAPQNTAKISQIKKQCADKVRASDKGVTQVTVSADADFLQRIQMIDQGIRQGTPVESFRNELTQMIKRVTPEKE